MNLENKAQVRILRLPHAADLPLPAYQTAHAAGLDLVAAVPEPIIIVPGGRAAIPTGFAFALPPDVEGQIRPRSGLALHHGVTVLNSPGTLDADYRGEVHVILANFGDTSFAVARGTRIAQLVFAPTMQAAIREVASLNETTRGIRGFGSTGTGGSGPLTEEEWFQLPLDVRQRWWRQTDYSKRPPSPELTNVLAKHDVVLESDISLTFVERKRIALHEAAHAVAARAYELPVDFASIGMGGKWGQIWYAMDVATDWERTVIALAGPAADVAFPSDCRGGERQDFINARLFAERLDPRNIDGVIAQAQLAAEEIVRTNRTVISCLGAILEHYRKLSGEEIDGIIGSISGKARPSVTYERPPC